MSAQPASVPPSNPFRELWDLGYTRLVPVVPPGADLSEKSSLAARARAGSDERGKAPGVKRADGLWTGLQFTGMESQEQDLDVWNAWGASVGIKTGDGLIALDIDTTNKDAARNLFQLAAQILGPASVRFGRHPKCLMLYEAPKDTGYKQLRFSTETEDEARLEILSEGRQFVARGIHPKTGKPYTWPQGVPRREGLTRVSSEQIEQFLTEAAKALPNSRIHNAADDRQPVDQEDLRAPSWEALKTTVEAVPNVTALFPSRDDYVKVAYAIKAACPEGYEHDALELYLDWCGRWDGGENDPDIALADWNRAKPPFRVGFSFLQRHAAALFFQPVEADPLDDLFSAQETGGEGASPGLYEILRIGDIFALPDPTFAVDRHIPEASMGFLYGRPGCGKSFIALDWALHIAYGLPAWHGDPITVRPGANVLYLAREGSTGFKARIRAWQEKHMVPADREPTFALIRQTINFMQAEDIGKIVRTARQALHGPVDLIVVDTVSRVLPGADENLQKEMTLFVKACDALQDAFKAIVLGVHHSGKSGDMRGSSVLKGAGDFVFKLERKEGARTGQLICEKQKDAPDGWSETYAFPVVEFGGGAGQSLVPERVQGHEAASDTCDEHRREDILAAIQAAWDAGNPWSPAPQAKERYAVKRMSMDFDVKAEVAEQWLAIWLDEGRIVVEVADRHSKSKGYKLASPVVEDTQSSDVFD